MLGSRDDFSLKAKGVLGQGGGGGAEGGNF